MEPLKMTSQRGLPFSYAVLVNLGALLPQYLKMIIIV
jgi:hypothetical protein